MAQATVEEVEATPPRRAGDIVVPVIGFALLGLAALWLIVEFVGQPSQFTEYTLAGLNNGALYALIALGYTLVYGIIELINFSHGDLFMLSTVVSGIVAVTLLGAASTISVGSIVAVFVALVVAMFAAAAVNTTAERVAYRRLRRAPKLAPLITAVGLSFIYQWLGQQSWMSGSAPKNWPSLLRNRSFEVGNVTVPWGTVIVIAVTIPLLLGLTYIVQSTRQGKAMRATAQDQDAARLMGIDVDRTIAFTFALGGAMAGAAGLLWLESVATTRYDAGFKLGLIAFTAAVLGGIGNLNGAVLGGFLIGLIEAWNDGLGLGPNWSNSVVFTILIALMVFRPEGILGNATTEKV
ncbi:branched-chain amino acid ABC transporter permease [Spongisporangium articulatum]|uniref:Branched-chain amino acid ABC transporter permease n=1 Tax=Spongisporangium articulatum TaxID=3362603 RepID=A0ABW8ARE3_9ACTN